MRKKSAVVVLASLLSSIGPAWGLGLGDIRVKSNLNEPLEAEIQLLELQGLSAGEILPTLASSDDFRRAGVERNFFLSNIQFRTVKSESGGVVMTLTTRQAVREPFLNFLVEVNWPGGRLLKEYTVLLDPPVFDADLSVDSLQIDSRPIDLQQSVPQPNAPTQEIKPSATLETSTEASVTSQVTQAAPEPAVVREDNLDSDQYRVQTNDTLWEIALRVPEGSGYTPQQIMLALQDLNADAFYGNNINRLKAGTVLELPSADQIAIRTVEQALAEVQEQNSGRRTQVAQPDADMVDDDQEPAEVQLSATESTASALPSDTDLRNPDGYLEVATDNDSISASAAGQEEDGFDVIESRLLAAEEANLKLAQENEQLKRQLQMLSPQVDQASGIADVQNNELASLQESLSETEQEISRVQETLSEFDSNTVDSIENMDEESNTFNAQDDSTTFYNPDAELTNDDGSSKRLIVKELDGDQNSSVSVDTGALGFLSSLVKQVTTWITASYPNMMIAVVGLLMVLLSPFLLRGKRNSDDRTLGEIQGDLQQPQSMQPDGDDRPDVGFGEDLLALSEDEPMPAVQEELNAVVEAEMYIAYQKYDQAEEKLKEAFAEHPTRYDVGLKLLGLYAQTGDVNAFNQLEQRLELNDEQLEEVARLREKLPVDTASNGDDDVLGALSEDIDLENSLDDSDFGSSFDSSASDTLLTPQSSDNNTLDDFDFDSHLPESEASIGKTDSFDSVISEHETKANDSVSDESDLELELNLDDMDLDSDELDIDIDQLDEEIQALSESIDDNDSVDFELNLDDLEDKSSDTSAQDVLSQKSASADEKKSKPSEVESVPTLNQEVLDDTTEIDLDLSDLDVDEASDDNVAQAEKELSMTFNDDDMENDEFDFISESDGAGTKLDLARAYIEMDDKEGAKDILEEVLVEGDESQRSEAEALLKKI